MRYCMYLGLKFQYILVILFILTGLVLYILNSPSNSLQKVSLMSFMSFDDQAVKGFLVHTPSCRIPDMNPYDKSILKYLTKPVAFQCSDKLPLIESNQTSIWINSKAISSYNVLMSGLDCCYKSFNRDEADLGNINVKIDETLNFSKNCIKFEKDAEIDFEFVEVSCKYKKSEIYRDYHAFTVNKKKKNSSVNEKESDALSVLIIGVDAMSRLNFHRQMPMTREFLNSLESLNFLGFNKVDDNTFPNLVPVLSGYTESEIRRLCWSKDDNFFDDCPWIWKNYSANNYYTAFGEDTNWISLFNYQKRGFLQPPVDYYIRPYMKANEDKIGHSQHMNTKYCAGSRFTSDILLDYAYKFSENMTLSKKKFWGFFWENSLTHDDVNIIWNTDEIFYNLFKKLESSNVLNSTAVIFMSDHGMRWGSIRETYQGRMEERLPFLYILLPTWFKKKYILAMWNMEKNTHLLTTHFDIHETLKDLLDLDNLKEENIELRSKNVKNKRGVSLFLPVSPYRTCTTAGIGRSWCTCQRSESISKGDKNVERAAQVIVSEINKMLIMHKECAQLQLYKIIRAHIEIENELVQKETSNKFTDYVIIVVTSPGFGKYEATIRHRSESNEMTLLGYISRINLYGDQSQCMSNYRLKTYCFCI